jgi:hypothetical protein
MPISLLHWLASPNHVCVVAVGSPFLLCSSGLEAAAMSTLALRQEVRQLVLAGNIQAATDLIKVRRVAWSWGKGDGRR